MICRKGCAACCIFADISSSIPNHPNGKPFGVRCKNLNEENLCMIHNTKDYPEVCQRFTAEKEFCGDTKEEAAQILTSLMS